MNTHRAARTATTLACVGIACLIDHFLSDRISTRWGTALLILVNIVLFSAAVWHFKKAWWLTSVLIASMITLPVKTASGDSKPQVILCIIVGGVILIGGSYAAYKIYKCAKKNLNPPPPPTNAPPNNKPGEWDAAPMRTMAATSWADLPCADIAVDDNVATNGWTDWQGNPIAYAFGGTITNFVRNGQTHFFQSSTNLTGWSVLSLAITGWVSQVNGMDSNQVSITYHNGKPLCTNWHRVDNTQTNAVLLGTTGHPFPVEGNGFKFFKLAPLAAAPQ